MDVSNLLTQDTPQRTRSIKASGEIQQQQEHYHSYATRNSRSSYNHPNAGDRNTTPPTHLLYSAGQSAQPTPCNQSPPNPSPKHVAFELLLPESPNQRARLPMRVNIFPHDTTESIITTVKNFYGLYEGVGGARGVSFQDEDGNTLIARYENFKNNMTIYVRVVPNRPSISSTYDLSFNNAMSPLKSPHLDEAFNMPPPQSGQVPSGSQPPSRSASRMARQRSVSPQTGRGRRSVSASKNNQSRPGALSRGSSSQEVHHDGNSDAMNGYSSDEGGQGSVTSSRKAKSEQLASAEISLDNILEGGRRKRAKFESSELPLFVPPQVPITTSTSSISPQRRTDNQSGPSPVAYATQRSFSFNQSLQSPQSWASHGHTFNYPPQVGLSYPAPPGQQHGSRLPSRDDPTYPLSSRDSIVVPNGRASGVLPTPDPTVGGSCISDEDVALQLMRLGNTSNISRSTRNSGSTFDDGFSGAADVASSTSATSESGDGTDATEKPSLPTTTIRSKLESGQISLSGPLKRSHKHLGDVLPSFDSTEPSGDDVDGDIDCEDKKDGSFQHEDFMNELEDAINPPAQKPKSFVKPHTGSSSSKNKVNKPRPSAGNKKHKAPASTNGSKLPISPTSLPPQSRKASAASTLKLGEDEEDLSSKPRCQRCRKSKKGCDRQRPCQRCKDAGIGIEGCISEDEGNGRKGRYGRHMGVTVRKDAAGMPISDGGDHTADHAMVGVVTGVQANLDKSKKRKR
ncbi:MAG: hypothetical protein M1835_005933 [Candelina submexicana]|nr:MAG: hypothetical protein M1835_005933 [Candelina submexicana]